MTFVTQHLKKPWMGGNRALSQIAAILKKKGAAVTSSAIVHWSSPQRDNQIDDLVAKLSLI